MDFRVRKSKCYYCAICSIFIYLFPIMQTQAVLECEVPGFLISSAFAFPKFLLVDL